jgi:hypothetical protein
VHAVSKKQSWILFFATILKKKSQRYDGAGGIFSGNYLKSQIKQLALEDPTNSKGFMDFSLVACLPSCSAAAVEISSVRHTRTMAH